jgi:beta-glucanase (GH16 family)
LISLSFLYSADELCSEPTFEDEFDGEEWSDMWVKTNSVSFDGSASLLYPNNVNLLDDELVLNLEFIGTTDSSGTLFRSTSGEVKSSMEFGYGRYEFRIWATGIEPMTETVLLLWDGDNYAKHHEIIGFDLLEKGYMTLMATGVMEDDEVNTFHNTKLDQNFEGEKISLKYHLYQIDYFPEKVIWYYDNEAIRQELASAKTLPDQKMRVVFRNWLVEDLQYSLTNDDLPVEFKIDYFKFTPLNEDEDSCSAIEDSDIGTVTNQTNELQTKIEGLEFNKNFLLGASEKIDNFSIFKSARVVWIFSDEKWKAYSPYRKIRETLEANGIEVIEEIPAYSGFWIQK